MIGTEFGKQLCEHITEECVYVKHKEGLQPVELGVAASAWLSRIAEQVGLRTELNGTEIIIIGNPVTEAVTVTYSLNGEQIECLRRFDDIADLVGEPVTTSITVKW